MSFYSLEEKCYIKVALIGPTRAGKTSLVLFIKDNYVDFSAINSTVSSDSYHIQIDDIPFCFIDTAGQERFQSVTAFYLNTCEIGLLCVDPNDDLSLNLVDVYAQMLLDKHVKHRILVLTKCDLKKSSFDEIENFQKKWECQYAISTSVVEKEGIIELKRIIIDCHKQISPVSIISPDISQQKKSQCCSGN